MTRVAFCVSGRGALFRSAVGHAVILGIEPVLLVLDRTADPELAAFATGEGLTVAGADDLAAALDLARPDLVALTFDRIIPADLLGRQPMINVHPALLPAFAGTKAIERTLASGVRFGGATIHEVAADIDGGPVIAQTIVPLEAGDTVETYGRRLYGQLEPMYLAVLSWFAQGRVGHDAKGRVAVAGARYGELPTSPVD